MIISKLVFVVCLSLNFSIATASERVEFSADRIHGLYVFVESIAGTPFRHEDIKRVFEGSKFHNPKSKQMLEEFRALDFSLGREIYSNGAPERNSGRSVKDAIISQASFAKNLPDLRQRTVALLPLPDLNKLFKILNYFDPIYESLLWKANKAFVAKTANTFKQKSVAWKLDDLFARAAKFYKTDWPKEQKFRVSLLPLPSDSKHSNATAYGAVESVGVNPKDKDTEGLFGVIFHELCHSLYEAQSDKTQASLAEWIRQNPSKYAPLTYNYLNEALATAIGNGWAYHKIKGKTESADWYAEEKINGLAKAIFPKVQEYLNQSKEIDPVFINFAVVTFEKLFPNSLLEFQPVLNNIVLLSDGVVNIRDLRRELRTYFRVVSITGASPINDDEILNQVRKVPSTVFAIVTQKQRSQIDTLDDVFKGISEHIELLPQAGNFLAMFDIGVRKVIILIVDDPALVPKAFKIMGQKKKVEKLNSFVELKFQP